MMLTISAMIKIIMTIMMTISVRTMVMISL